MPYLPEGQAPTAPSYGIAADSVSPLAYPSGCGFFVAVWKQGSYIVGSTLTSCTAAVGYIYQSVLVQRQRWWGWEDLRINANERYNAASLAVDVWYNCSGTGTHNFKAVGSGRVVKNGTTYYASAYDQINNIAC